MEETRPRADAIIGSTLVGGLLFGFVISLRLRGNEALQASMSNAGGVALLATLSVAVFGAAILYGQTSAEHKAYVKACVLASFFSTMGFIPAHHYKWLTGLAFEPPLLLQLAVYGLALSAYCFFGLGVLRVFEHRRGRRTGLVAYAVFVALWAGVGALSTQKLQDSGDYVMGHGYNEAWDTAWSFAMFVALLVMYLRFRSRPSD